MSSEPMIYGFATDSIEEATAALCVFVVWKSRDRGKYKPGPGMWGQIRGFVKAAAKSSTNIPRFTEDMMARLGCSSLSSRWVAVGLFGDDSPADQGDTIMRAYLQDIRSRANEKRVLDIAANETVTVIELLKQRLDDAPPRTAPTQARKVDTGQMNLFAFDPDDVIDLGVTA